jgi:hypothetical protein
MSKKDLTAAMKLLDPYGVSSFECGFISRNRYSVAVKFLDGTVQFFKLLSEVQAWVDLRALDQGVLSIIARVNFGIEVLEAQNRDSLDFHEVHVLQIKKALRDAFEAGARSVQSAK